MTAFDFGVNCVAMGVGERVGMGVNVGGGERTGVNALVGNDEGVGLNDVNCAKLQAMINRAHISKRIARWLLMVFGFSFDGYSISVTWQMQ